MQPEATSHKPEAEGARSQPAKKTRKYHSKKIGLVPTICEGQTNPRLWRSYSGRFKVPKPDSYIA